MGKVLSGLIVCILLLTGVALWQATSVYGKRELIIARNQVLTGGYLKLAPTIVDKFPEDGEQKLPEGRDLSPLTPEYLEKAPEKSDFWQKKYSPAFALEPKAMLNLNERKRDLANLYKVNALGDVEMDENGHKRMDGEGTIQGVIL